MFFLRRLNTLNKVLCAQESCRNHAGQLCLVHFSHWIAEVELFISYKKHGKIKLIHKVCNANFNDSRSYISNKNEDLPMIYFVTPTYPRPEQTPELTRLAHTLMHVPRIHWIVADDQISCSDQVLSILRRSGLPFTHISSPKPNTIQNYNNNNIARGVANRLAALSWLRAHIHDGVLYFGDDDNTVDLQLFDEIRHTKKVSMFPVGLIGEYGVSTPVVKNGKVVGFFDSWFGSRTFPVDMAGFAINIKFLKPNATMPFIVGYEEDKFLVSLGLKIGDIEPLAENCTKVLVWHTKIKQFKKGVIKVDMEKLNKTVGCENFAKLLNETSRLDMAQINDIATATGIKATIIRNHKSYTPESLLGLI